VPSLPVRYIILNSCSFPPIRDMSATVAAMTDCRQCDTSDATRNGNTPADAGTGQPRPSPRTGMIWINDGLPPASTLGQALFSLKNESA
jgi:hypothetical protein